MAVQPLYPPSFKNALQEASNKNARRFDIIVGHVAEEPNPYRIAIRKLNTPTKQGFSFPSALEAEAFLRQLISMAS